MINRSRLREGLVAGVPLLAAAVVLALFLLWLALEFFFSSGGSGPTGPFLPTAALSCSNADTRPPGVTRSVAFVLTGLVAFIIGNLAGGVRTRGHTGSDRGKAIYQIVVTFILVVATLALGYETVSTWLTDHERDTSFWQITSYVRCSVNHYPFFASVPAVVIPFLAGHWLHRGA